MGALFVPFLLSALAVGVAFGQYGNPDAGQPETCSRYPLLCPHSGLFVAKAPDEFSVQFDTNVGSFVINAVRKWAPHGVDRFYALVDNGFYDDTRYFRTLAGFVTQFGMSGNPILTSLFENDDDLYHTVIPDDEIYAGISNIRGFVTYAAVMNDAGKATNRTTELFINYGNNSRLDGYNFAPFGFVTETDMAVVDSIYSKYGEVQEACQDPHKNCTGPSVERIANEGNAYLLQDFPLMSFTYRAYVLEKKLRTSIGGQVPTPQY